MTKLCRRLPVHRSVVVRMLIVDYACQVFRRAAFAGGACLQRGENRRIEIRQPTFASVHLRDLHRSRCVETADRQADRVGPLAVGEEQRLAATRAEPPFPRRRTAKGSRRTARPGKILDTYVCPCLEG